MEILEGVLILGKMSFEYKVKIYIIIKYRLSKFTWMVYIKSQIFKKSNKNFRPIFFFLHLSYSYMYYEYDRITGNYT